MAVRIRPMFELKAQLMRPATTSNFECSFTPPQSVKNFIDRKFEVGAGPNLTNYTIDKINISCCDASLPGSSLQTGQMLDSYTGVTETYAYRRAYDNRADFTFYVDNSDDGLQTKPYTIILFFENWIAYIAGEDNLPNMETPNYFYRVNFPDNYMSKVLEINKFEKDVEKTKSYLQYKFINAYPISMTSMPVSYESSQVLKCTVSFSYQRYTVKLSSLGIVNPTISPINPSVIDPNSPGSRELPTYLSPTLNPVTPVTGNGQQSSSTGGGEERTLF